MVLTVSFALSPGTGLSCPRRRLRCRKHRGLLDASVGASGPRDFAVRLFAPFVKGAKASTASRSPTSVTIAKRPSLKGTGRGELLKMICPTGGSIYFRAKDWTGSISLIGFGKSSVWRKGSRPSGVTIFSPPSFRDGALAPDPESRDSPMCNCTSYFDASHFAGDVRS
jgi:hypothetical protein